MIRDPKTCHFPWGKKASFRCGEAGLAATDQILSAGPACLPWAASLCTGWLSSRSLKQEGDERNSTWTCKGECTTRPSFPGHKIRFLISTHFLTSNSSTWAPGILWKWKQKSLLLDTRPRGDVRDSRGRPATVTRKGQLERDCAVPIRMEQVSGKLSSTNDFTE